MEVNKKQNSLKAFTLAEVLIVLSIIGVVAAMTIPIIMAYFQKQVAVTRLQKMYTNLSQVIKRSEADNGPIKGWDLGSSNGVGLSAQQSFDTYWAPYLKISKNCATSASCGYKTGGIKTLDQTDIISIGTGADRVTVMLADGNMLIVRVPGGWIEQIYVDINGANPPNRFGNDAFIFTLDQKKGLVPHNSNCTFNGNGEGCAAKIIKDGWQIKDDYPWY